MLPSHKEIIGPEGRLRYDSDSKVKELVKLLISTLCNAGNLQCNDTVRCFIHEATLVFEFRLFLSSNYLSPSKNRHTNVSLYILILTRVLTNYEYLLLTYFNPSEYG